MHATTSSPSEHVDVLIVGAGISGLGAARELTVQRPGQSFLILEGMESFGGTWHWHRYPGIRSDSDLYTFGYRFKPWIGPPIASGQEILRYLGEVIDENGLAAHIRYRHRVLRADWDSTTALWTITALDTEHSIERVFTCNFLWMCQGYYRHERGYTPTWPDMDTFKGQIVHPQTWPQGLDYAGKRVVVIGSGATAATVVPAIAPACEHVTMLQRSPTYFSPGVNRHWLADTLRELNVDDASIHDIVRRKIVFDQYRFLQRTLDDPDSTVQDLLKGVRAYLPKEIVEKHFTPRYRPWQQRIAVVPDGDLFEQIKAERVSVVTDRIERFTPDGILVGDGQELKADIIVTATGFDLSVLGDIKFTIDGSDLDFANTVTYRGMMFTGVPNMAWIFGYFRAASWTLRVDMVADFVCRLLGHMEARGSRKVEVVLRDEDADMPLLPWIDDALFNPGYMMRGMHLLPKRGPKPEWAHSQDYWWERDVLPGVSLDDPTFRYDNAVIDTSSHKASQIRKASGR